MGTKTKRDYNDPLSIWQEMAAFDRKDYTYYDRLTDDQKKEFSPYLMMRWGSTVDGNNDTSKYYALASNEYVNNNFWQLSKHPKLQWLLCCAVSPTCGKQKHYWIGSSKKESTNSLRKLLVEYLPNTKSDEIDLILKVNTRENIKDWLRCNGIEEKILNSL
jgi:hypothetical protein